MATPFLWRSDTLEAPMSTTNACKMCLGEREGDMEERCALRAYFICLVEGRVADPDPDPEKIRIRWVGGS